MNLREKLTKLVENIAKEISKKYAPLDHKHPNSTLYGVCSTSSYISIKTLTCENFDKLTTGMSIHVKFANSNTAKNPSLNINGTGAIPMSQGGKDNNGELTWEPGSVIPFTYDGNKWIMNGGVSVSVTTVEGGNTSSGSGGGNYGKPEDNHKVVFDSNTLIITYTGYNGGDHDVNIDVNTLFITTLNYTANEGGDAVASFESNVLSIESYDGSAELNEGILHLPMNDKMRLTNNYIYIAA